jgi:hypothetical protein
MLDTVMLYWLSNPGAFSACFHWERKVDLTARVIDLPASVSWSGGDNYHASREWCER